ncbi:MAG TPA: hypothetical protein VG942_15335 [Hyphomonadaceae bacterium]|nr:hypothetical protein [Hyphomonadaceae bacterium]
MSETGSDKPNTEQAFANFDLKAEAPEARKPAVRFAFEFPQLLDLFVPADEAAARERRSSRILGVFAVFIVAAALMLASLGPLISEQADDPASLSSPHTWLGLGAAALGIFGTVLGLLGSRRGASRRKWLQARLKTETLRLFHFHYIAARLPEIVAINGDEHRKQHYIEARLLALERLKVKVLADPEAELERIIARKEETSFQSIAGFEEAHGDAVPPVAEDVFAAWQVLRLNWQATYCAAKLEHRRPDGGMTPKGMEEMFERLAWFFVGAIILIHVAHFFNALADLRITALEVAVIWVALAALAARALEDGFQPMREVERYEQYRANVRVAEERFEAAKSFPAKVEALRAFERTSLEEMRVFLRTHARARFLL